MPRNILDEFRQQKSPQLVAAALCLPYLFCCAIIPMSKKIHTEGHGVLSMSDYNKIDDNMQTFLDFDDSVEELDLIPVEPQITPPDVPISKKNFSHPVLTFDNSNEESDFKEKTFVSPDTHFSPKDKVSNRTWDNKLPIGRDMGIITARKNDYFGCVVHLDYESIINSDDVVTGAVLSKFDRCVYDAVVTLFVAGNAMFSTTDIWRIVSHNPHAKITPVTRDKIIKSMFHISKFWMTIVTDDSEKCDTWYRLNCNDSFKSERKFYKHLQTTYTGRLLDFRVIGKITFDVSFDVDGKTFTEKKSFADIWKLGFPPILYQYAQAKGQISAVPMKYLDTSKKPDKKNSIKRGFHSDELTQFLSREIDTMKKTAKRKKSYSHIILLERIYKIDGIDDIQKTASNVRLKKKRTRDKLEKILSRFKENALIQEFTLHKKLIGKSVTFYSVEIFI